MANFFATGATPKKPLTPPITVQRDEVNGGNPYTLVNQDGEHDLAKFPPGFNTDSSNNKFYYDVPASGLGTLITDDQLPIKDENGKTLVEGNGSINLAYGDTVDDPAAEEDTGDNPSVNGAITDAVTQANVKVLADSPAMSLSNLYQTVSQSLSLSVQNAVTMQQQNNILHQASTTQGVNLLYTVGTAAVGMAASEALESDTSDNLVNMLSSAIALNKQK